MKPTWFIPILLIGFAVMACEKKQTPDTGDSVYPHWETSPYILPYPVGARYHVSQGNHFGGHKTIAGGAFRYSYDFAMPIGSLITAARGGRVVYTRTHFRDGNSGAAIGSDNVVLIEHADRTFALYGHLTHDGALVSVGESVVQGQPVAHSGNTGRTGGLPHLHFMVSQCPHGDIPCGPEHSSIPVTFRNTRANPEGLQTHQEYLAEGFTPLVE